MPTNPNGRVLYEGPSLLDGAPIVVIATGFAERGHKTTCAACTLCDGATANVVIHAHGSRASRVALRN
jgi:hypothetical protein